MVLAEPEQDTGSNVRPAALGPCVWNVCVTADIRWNNWYWCCCKNIAGGVSCCFFCRSLACASPVCSLSLSAYQAAVSLVRSRSCTRSQPTGQHQSRTAPCSTSCPQPDSVKTKLLRPPQDDGFDVLLDEADASDTPVGGASAHAAAGPAANGAAAPPPAGSAPPAAAPPGAAPGTAQAFGAASAGSVAGGPAPCAGPGGGAAAAFQYVREGAAAPGRPPVGPPQPPGAPGPLPGAPGSCVCSGHDCLRQSSVCSFRGLCCFQERAWAAASRARGTRDTVS